ncbi:peptidase C45 [Planctomicrobium sp. SH664]|uniref:peptidase C45 n=1 Tax=Planctomicrobium sp. SH664 TaxID=3448125 RepID=UPI003F5C6FCB
MLPCPYEKSSPARSEGSPSIGRNRILFLYVLLYSVCLSINPVSACTTAIFSGRVTADGRPLLWKNRDFNITANEVIYFNDGKYPCIGLVNAASRTAIWMGVNNVGLCIENSLSPDLDHPNTVKGYGNGDFMLTALKTCATVADVEELLKKTNVTGRSTSANFGVIDAQGGAIIFETSHNNYTRFDANDPVTAPQGYIVRSNFSVTGRRLPQLPTRDDVRKIKSADRYLRATELVNRVVSGGIDMKYLLRNCARDLDCAGEDCPGGVNAGGGSLPEFVPTANTISRTTTVSWVVFQGVKPDEDPLLTTMWLGLGDPKFSVAVPCWVAQKMVASELQGKQGGPIGQKAVELRSCFYDRKQDGIRTDGLEEIWSILWAHEDKTLELVERQLQQWRDKGIEPESMKAIHLSSAEQALALLSELAREANSVRTVPASTDAN